MEIEMISKVWPEWQIEKVLGKGSYGTVYKAVRRDSNIESFAAIKVISIPMDRSEIESLRSEGLSEEGTKTYFQGIVNDFVSEIRLMESLKGTQNIVGVEDYKVVERTNEIGWEIFIRMELLTPFNTYLCNKTMTEAEVLKLGIDICSALEICEHRKIVHRDIKPENIFINDFGYFKLGDFGIARTLENATGGLSQKGTFNYMAPEVAAGRNYDARVDIYSLGIVLYRLLNGNRLPFIENDEQLLNPNARKMAVDRRMRGDNMVAPCNASPQAAAVVMRACAYSAEARFAGATEMKKVLQQAELGVYVDNDIDLDKTVSVRRAQVNLDATVGVNQSFNYGTQNQNNVPNVQGWSQVTPKQEPQVNNPVTPVYATPANVAPVNQSTPPVYKTPVNQSTPPVYKTPVNQSTPPVYKTPVNQSTPPVYKTPVNQSTPPVYKTPVNQSTPPVYNPPVNQSTPPVQQAPVVAQNTEGVKPAAKPSANAEGVIAMLFAFIAIIMYDSNSTFSAVMAVLAAAMTLVGKVNAKKKGVKGGGLLIGGVIFTIFAIILGFMWFFVDMYYEESSAGAMAAAVAAVYGVLFAIVGKKKK